jgi:PAS domain S-box-containing protein
MPKKWEPAGMFWEATSIVDGMAKNLFVAVSYPSTLSTFFLFFFLLLAFGAAFFYARREWRLERLQLIVENQKLRESHQIIRQRAVRFGQMMSLIVMETDQFGRIQFINGSWRKFFANRGEDCRQPGSVFDLIHADDHAGFQQHFNQLLAGQVQPEARFRLQGSSGLICPVSFSGEANLERDNGKVTSLNLVFEDMSQEERTSRALGQKQATEMVITTILKSFGVANNEDLEEALSGALQQVAELVQADRCLLFDVESDERSVRPVFFWSSEEAAKIPSPPYFFSLSDCPWLKEAILADGLVNIPNIAELPGEMDMCRKMWHDFGIVSLVFLPIRILGEMVGILGFSTIGREAQWTPSDLHLFEVVAAMYSGARQRETHQQELKAANRKLESIVEFLPDATFVINSRKEVVAWNRALEELTGIPKEEMLGQGDYAYAVPFYGDRLPTLINHFGDVDLSQWRQLYNFVEINGSTLYAESFVPFLNGGQGAYLWLTASALYDEEGQVIGAIQSVRDVTYRKKSEQALRTSEDRYRRLVETMNDGMGVVSVDGCISFANDSLCQMLRLQKEEILGVAIDSLFPEIKKQGPLEDWPGWQTSAGEALEFDITRRDGSEFPARLSPAAILDEEGKFQGGFAIISDLSKIREAEARIHKLNENLEQRVSDSTHELLATNSALRQSEARFRRIIESLKDGYIFYSQDTRRMFTYISPSYRNLLGFENLDDLGNSLRKDIDLPVNKESKFRAQKSILGYRQAPWDLHVSCRDGSLRIIEILEVPVFDNGGEVISVEGIGRDVTETRHNEELIKDAQLKLLEQEKLAALGSLVAGLSHEINTPVGIGVTAASHLNLEVQECLRAYRKSELTRQDFEEFLDLSRESSDLIASNLNRAADLLQNFKLVATDQSAEMERLFNLKEYLEDVTRSLSPRLRNTGFHISVDCPADLEMKCDPGSLYQILSNLIINSLMHGFEGLLVGQISISASLETTGLVIAYSDNGNGMSRMDQARIYEPFFTTKRGRGGTGLGMHIVYNNVTQNLGGSISCSSKPGRGTRFTISVPLLAEVEHG